MRKINPAARLIVWIGAFLTIQACGIDESHLTGHWQAVSFYEQGQTVVFPLDSIRLAFAPDNHYHFQSVGQYREAGPYRLLWRYLSLRDTTANPPQERMVEILFASADTLKIRMRKADKEQVLFLAKR